MNIHETKTHLSRLKECAAAGEEIAGKAGKPLAKLVHDVAAGALRKGGFHALRIHEVPGAWEPEANFASGALFPISKEPEAARLAIA